MNNIIRAAMGAGALGAFLSGAGSTVLALATEKEFTIGYEMADAAVKSGLDGEVRITRPTSRGVHVVDS
jgi:homoserine kinase